MRQALDDTEEEHDKEPHPFIYAMLCSSFLGGRQVAVFEARNGVKIECYTVISVILSLHSAAWRLMDLVFSAPRGGWRRSYFSVMSSEAVLDCNLSREGGRLLVPHGDPM